jgi:hypothetical protein
MWLLGRFASDFKTIADGVTSPFAQTSTLSTGRKPEV